MTKSRNILRPRRYWTDAEDAVLRARYPHEVTKTIAEAMGRPLASVYVRAQALGLEKSAQFRASPAACRMTGKETNSWKTRFKPGQPAWNKGTHYVAGGRSAETHFKPGVRQGVAVKLYQPIGSERVSKDGYLERKVNDDLPLQARWRAVHLVEWEAIHGRIPPGHALVFRDGNKSNTAPENMELVTRAELMRRNSYHNNYPKEVAQLIQLKGALQRKINRRSNAS